MTIKKGFHYRDYKENHVDYKHVWLNHETLVVSLGNGELFEIDLQDGGLEVRSLGFRGVVVKPHATNVVIVKPGHE